MLLISCALALFGAVVARPLLAQAPAAAAAGAPVGDPAGTATGTAKDVAVKDAANPQLAEVMETVGHTMSMNFMVYAVGMLGFWVCGYALQMGGVGAVAALGGTPTLNHEFTVSLFGRFSAFILFGFFGGVAALAGAIVIGPRIGKCNADGTANVIPGHNLPMAVAGTFILAVGWFGFNAGSTQAGTDLRIAVVAVNTMLASAAGAFAAMLYVWTRYGKPDPGMLVNGFLAGLVAITAPCAFVNSVSAVVIGGLAGVLVVVAACFIERTLKIDDPVGAVAVHGVCGAWGMLSLGLFADVTYGDAWNGVPRTVRGLFYGDASQLAAEAIGVVTCFVFIFTSFYLFFKLVEVTLGKRVAAQDEINGLDVPEMGSLGYPDPLVEAAAAARTLPLRPAVPEPSLGGATLQPAE